jgi:hypothetical protein
MAGATAKFSLAPEALRIANLIKPELNFEKCGKTSRFSKPVSFVNGKRRKAIARLSNDQKIY